MSMLRKRLILFLSTGDTCRSPMAAIYLRHLLEEHGVHNVEVRTAGVSTIVGLLASQETIQVMKSEGLDASKHRSNQLSPVALRRATIIFGMTPFHVQRALRMMPEARGKVHLLKEFTKSDLSKVQIDDPMGGTLEIYRKCFEEIKGAIDRLIYMPKAIGRELKPEDRKPKPAPEPKAETAEEAPAKPAAKPKAAAAKPAAKKKAPAKKATAKRARKKAAKKKVSKKAAKKAAKKKAAKKAAKKAVKKKAPKKTAKKAAKKKAAQKKPAKRASKTTTKKKAVKKKSATKKAAGKSAKRTAKRKPAKKTVKKTAKKKASKRTAKKKAGKKTASRRRR